MGILNSIQLRMHAGHHERRYCPVTFNVKKDLEQLNGGPVGRVRLLDEQGKDVTVQCREESDHWRIQFIVENLPKNTSATYVLEWNKNVGPEEAEAGGVQIIPEEGKLDIRINGEFFTSYVYDAFFAKPYLGPIMGPYGDSFTRLDFETREHPHHRSLWFAIGDVNGIDFWNEPAGIHGKQLHREFSDLSGGPLCATLTANNVWTSFKDKPQIDEKRTITIYNTPAEGRIIDLEIAFTANYGKVEFGATKEAGPLGIRVAESMKVANGGTMTNAYGSVSEEECWGQRAQWCDYYGDVAEHTLGIAVFDHPDNEHFPTYWHIRNYGLHAANNFYFIGGKLIQPGETVKYRYRVYFHDGDTQKAKVTDRYQDYIHPPKVELV